MGNGHTAEGGWPVSLEFTADEVDMLIRSIETAVLSSGSDKNSRGQSQDTMQMMAYREFLKEILNNLRQALEAQRP